MMKMSKKNENFVLGNVLIESHTQFHVSRDFFTNEFKMKYFRLSAETKATEKLEQKKTKSTEEIRLPLNARFSVGALHST